MKKFSYYNYSRLLSYQGTFNVVCGARGLGKTFGWKKRAINDAIQNGNEFVYLRRYKEELKGLDSFFADIENEFPNHDFKTNGRLFLFAPVSTRDEKKRAWHTMGRAVALSTSQNEKGKSFHNVRSILFDEFIIEKGMVQYLPDEETVLMNFYITVDRWQDRTKLYMLSNSVSIMNPYFLKWKIRPDDAVKEFVIRNKQLPDGERFNFIVCHFPNAEAFQGEVFETKIGAFIKDTEYANYAVSNGFSDNTNQLLELKDSQARYQFTLETKSGVFSLWYSAKTGNYYVQSRIPRDNPMKFTTVPAKVDEDTTLMIFTDKPLSKLRTKFRHGKVRFDEPTTRNNFIEIFKR